MAEHKNCTFILTVLLVVFAFCLLSAIARIKSRINKYKSTDKKISTASLPQETVAGQNLEEMFSKTRIKRDPFTLGTSIEKEAAQADKSQASLTLTAIAWDKARPLAIINNEVLGVGDTINEARIIAIEKSKVKLDLNNQIIELELTTEEIRF